MPAEAVTAGKFTAICYTFHAVTAQHTPGIVEENVVECVVDANDHIRPQFFEHAPVFVCAERVAGPSNRHHFEKIKINMVQKRRGALNPIIEPDAERINLTRVFERPVPLCRHV